jgi:hypothetical protein
MNPNKALWEKGDFTRIATASEVENHGDPGRSDGGHRAHGPRRC